MAIFRSFQIYIKQQQRVTHYITYKYSLYNLLSPPFKVKLYNISIYY